MDFSIYSNNTRDRLVISQDGIVDTEFDLTPEIVKDLLGICDTRDLSNWNGDSLNKYESLAIFDGCEPMSIASAIDKYLK